MKKTFLVLSVTAALAACGGGSTPDTSALAEQLEGAPDIGAALEEVVDTASIEVSDEFAFNTARTIHIEFDIEEAEGTDASVSICTEYDKEGDAFDVDYSSCAVTATMLDGQFSHEMEVTNEYSSVVGVVWFQDENLEPLFREFSVDNTARSKDGSLAENRIVWR